MVCDRGRSYDALELEGVAQQKCLAHLIRNAAKVAEDKTGAPAISPVNSQICCGVRSCCQRAVQKWGSKITAGRPKPWMTNSPTPA